MGVQPPFCIIAIFSSYPVYPAHLISSAGGSWGCNPPSSQFPIGPPVPGLPSPPHIACGGGSRGGYPLLSQTLLGVIAHPRHCGEPQQGDRDCNGGANINPHYPDQLCPPDIVCGGVVGVQTPVSMRFSSPSQIPVYPAHLISSPGGRGVQPPVSIIAIFSSYPIHPAHRISSAGVVRMGDNPLQSQTLLGVHCRSPPPLRGPGLRPIAAASPNCR